MHPWKTPKANCYRVLLFVVYYPERTRPVAWWPIITADSEEEAKERAIYLYGLVPDVPQPHSRRTVLLDSSSPGPGLPIRGAVTVKDVVLLHPTSFHDER